MRNLIWVVFSAIMILLVTVMAAAAQDVNVHSAIHNLSENQVTWNSSDFFPGFYYDFDGDFGTENITFRLTDVDHSKSRAVLSDEPDASGNRGIVYATEAQHTIFGFGPWGEYEELGFLGGDYFAGYDNNVTDSMNDTRQRVPFLYDKSENRNLMANEQISELLSDNDTEQTFNSSKPLELEEGYKLAIKNIDADGKKVYVDLSKNGQVVDSKVVVPFIENADVNGGTYYYKRDLGDTRGIVTIAVHFKSAFSDSINSLATVDGIFQISDTPTSLKADQRYGMMSFREVNPTTWTIKMDNKDNKIVLSKNKDISLMDKIHIKTADQDDICDDNPLRYYIYSNESCEC